MAIWIGVLQRVVISISVAVKAVDVAFAVYLRVDLIKPAYRGVVIP